jgi:tyrosinase
MGGATITFAISAPGYSRLARAQPTRYVRRNIYDLARQNDPVIASYARAVDAMMKLPVDDPTSWWFQANMHDYPNSGGEGPLDEFTAPSKTDFFNKCPHGNFHFLPWHRLYLYYFERIVRKVSGNLNFALPFWNYERPGESTLPVPFRWRDDPMLPEPIPVLERPNPLARANRHSLINEGLFGMGDTASSSVAALAMANFLPVGGGTSFGGDGTGMLKQPVQSGELEGQPHDVVHGMIGIAGGDMASTRTAARDPIFWLHHAQIDRLWVEWVNRGDGRSNPVNNEDWMHTQFTFFDEDGNQVTKTAADALDTQLDFGYRYDTDPHRDEALVVAAQERHSDSALRSGPPTVELTEKAKSIKLGGRQATVNIPLSSTGRANLETARTSSAASQTRYFLVLENIKIDRMFSSYYEIYLNKPAEAAADPSGPYFVGTLAFFGMTHSHSDEGAKRVYDVTTIVETSLPGAGAMKNEINLTFVQRGPVGPAGEFLVDETVRPEIGSIRLLQR